MKPATPRLPKIIAIEPHTCMDITDALEELQQVPKLRHQFQ